MSGTRTQARDEVPRKIASQPVHPSSSAPSDAEDRPLPCLRSTARRSNRAITSRMKSYRAPFAPEQLSRLSEASTALLPTSGLPDQVGSQLPTRGHEGLPRAPSRHRTTDRRIASKSGAHDQASLTCRTTPRSPPPRLACARTGPGRSASSRACSLHLQYL